MALTDAQKQTAYRKRKAERSERMEASLRWIVDYLAKSNGDRAKVVRAKAEEGLS